MTINKTIRKIFKISFFTIFDRFISKNKMIKSIVTKKIRIAKNILNQLLSTMQVRVEAEVEVEVEAEVETEGQN